MKLALILLAAVAWGQDKPFVPGCLNGAIRYTPASIKWEECKENKWVQIGEPTSPNGPVTVYPEHQKTMGQQVAEEIERLGGRIAAQEKAINTITAILAEAAIHARSLEKRIEAQGKEIDYLKWAKGEYEKALQRAVAELERKGAKGR